jgi:hypothetical protein
VTLEPLPETFTDTRVELHRLAQEVISPAREQVTGRIGLRATPGGFGTPPFGDDDQQVRVDGAELVRQAGDAEDREPLVGVDEAASRTLAAWYAFGNSLLEELRAEATPAEAPSIVQLWPEHFDIAIELGDESDAARANYGFSPGDEDHAEPYVYVGPWAAERATGPLWNASGFPGAELSYDELLAAADPRRAALDFLREHRDFLRG